MNATVDFSNDYVLMPQASEEPNLIELSVAELACVGGGMVNVAFA